MFKSSVEKLEESLRNHINERLRLLQDQCNHQKQDLFILKFKDVYNDCISKSKLCHILADFSASPNTFSSFYENRNSKILDEIKSIIGSDIFSISRTEAQKNEAHQALLEKGFVFYKSLEFSFDYGKDLYQFYVPFWELKAKPEEIV